MLARIRFAVTPRGSNRSTVRHTDIPNTNRALSVTRALTSGHEP